MKQKLPLIRLALAAAVFATCSSQAQNVLVTTSLATTGNSAGVFDYVLTLNNVGTESIESFWLGWVPASFNVGSPTALGNNLGWTSTVSFSSSVQYGGTVGTAIAPGHSGIFDFDSTTTPAEFAAQTGQAGQSTAYGVNAVNGQNSFTLSPPDTATFGLTPAPTPEPSTYALLGLGSIGAFYMMRKNRPAAIAK